MNSIKNLSKYDTLVLNFYKHCDLIITNSGVTKHLVITNRLLEQIGHFTTQNNPLLTNSGHNKQKWPVLSCSL